MITDGISYWASLTPDQPAIVFDGRDVVDYATLDGWTDRAAAHLISRGIEPGDRVAVIGANSLEWCAAGIGALKAGAVVVPFNNRFTVPELEYLIADSEPRLVVTDPAARDAIRAAIGDRAITLIDMADVGAVRASASVGAQAPTRRPEDVAMIVYTSGSTAAPKGVIYTHGGMRDFVAELALSEPALTPGARIIYVLSMAGAPGLPWHILHPLTRGMTVYYEKGSDAATTLHRLRDAKITVMSGVPLQFEQIAALPEFADADLSALQMCTIAGARVPVPTLRAWLAKGVPLRQAYGMTELSGLSSINPGREAVTRPASIGRGTVFTRLRVVRPDGDDCEDGEQGEIIVKGPGIAAGYWRNADATGKLICDGWLHTGDIGIRDTGGFVEVVDRMKDLIISGGFNIAPSEIESVINDMPGVVEVCVVAAPDAKFGETPAAVVHGADTLTSENVLAWCDGRLARYKLPGHVVVEPMPLPRMTSGKIARREIAKRFTVTA